MLHAKFRTITAESWLIKGSSIIERFTGVRLEVCRITGAKYTYEEDTPIRNTVEYRGRLYNQTLGLYGQNGNYMPGKYPDNAK